MTDLLLGFIALATLATALVQLVAIVGLVRIGLRLKQRVDRLGRLLAPLASHVSDVSGNMSRAFAVAERQPARVVSAYAAIEVSLSRIATALAVPGAVAAALGRVRSVVSATNPTRPTSRSNS